MVPAIDLLDRWLAKKRMSVPAFAKLIMRDAQMVHAWRYLRAHPRILDILAICEVTGIEPKQWLDKTEHRRLRTIREATEERNAVQV